jgi:hypothetical protein
MKTTNKQASELVLKVTGNMLSLKFRLTSPNLTKPLFNSILDIYLFFT